MTRSDTSGLTIVEMLIGLILLSIVSSLTLMAFQTAMRSREVAENRVDAYEKGWFALNLISQDLRSTYLSQESVLSSARPWDETVPVARFVGINRVFAPPYFRYTLSDPQTEKSYERRVFVAEYPRDLLSFTVLQEQDPAKEIGSSLYQGDESVGHVVYTCVRNWQINDPLDKTRRMTLVRGLGAPEDTGFRTPMVDVQNPNFEWSAVCENVWGVDFQFFTYDHSSKCNDNDAGWTYNETPYWNESPYITRRWSEGMPEWHSGAESCLYALRLHDMYSGSNYLSYYLDSLDPACGGRTYEELRPRLPISLLLPTQYPLFEFDDAYSRYYYNNNETFFLSNEIQDLEFSKYFREYECGIRDDLPTHDKFREMMSRRDGLPLVVQITIWVQPGTAPLVRDYEDGREHPDDRFLPVMLQTRVYITSGDI